jgi:ABC-type multidrug transport system ATPase subunit
MHFVQGLKHVAQTGVTVTAVIHQPSYETFCLFDDLVLLAKGGLTAYCGPQRDVRVSLPAAVGDAS